MKKLMEQWQKMDLLDYYDNSLPFFEEMTLTTYMPVHQDNNHAVVRAYGFDPKVFADDNESLMVAELFKLYQKLSQ